MLVEINEQNIHQEIIEKSKTSTIVVFFYDSQDEKSLTLRDKINIYLGMDNQNITVAGVDLRNPAMQGLAMQFQLREIPAMAVVKESRVTALLEGQQVDTGYEQVLAELLPQKDQLLYDEAVKLIADKNLLGAMSKIEEAIAIKDNVKYRLTKADILIMQNSLEDAETILNAISMEEQLDEKAYYSSLKSALELAKKALDNSPIENLKKQVEEDPDNLDLKIELAVQYNQFNNKPEALNCLLEVLKKDLNYKDAKQTYLDIIATMGSSPDTSKFRRKLYSLIY